MSIINNKELRVIPKIAYDKLLTMKGGKEELIRASNIYNLVIIETYDNDWQKQKRYIVSDNGELELL